MDEQKPVPGKINVKQFTLINNLNQANEERIEIYSMVLGINLYENIFVETMYGNAKITDSYSLYSEFPINKDTYVLITLRSPMTGREVTSVYKVYKITDLNQESPKLQSYVIHFISVDAFNCQRFRVSDVVAGNGPSKIAEIHKQFSSKPIEVDKDASSLNLVLPHLRSIQAIRLIVENLKFRSVAPDYCYWETLYKYNCKSLMNCTLNSTVYELSTSQKLTQSTFESFDYSDLIKVEDMTVTKAFDDIEMLYSGNRGSTVYSYDPLKGEAFMDGIGQEPFAKADIYSCRALDYKQIAKRRQLLGQLPNSYKYISAPGLLERSSGDMVNLYVNSGDMFGTKNKVLSGMKLICGIAHNIINDNYYQHLTLGDYQFS